MATFFAEDAPADPSKATDPEAARHTLASLPDENGSRAVLTAHLFTLAGLRHVVNNGDRHLYEYAARAIQAGATAVEIHNRIYRIRQEGN